MARMLAEEFTQHLTESAPAAAAIANEHERDLCLLAGMLCGPRHPFNDVGVDLIIPCGEGFVDGLARKAPFAGPGRDAPAAPQVELAVNHRLPRRFEDDASVLPPMRVMEPPVPHIPGTVAHHD